MPYYGTVPGGAFGQGSKDTFNGNNSDINFLILDKRKNLKMSQNNASFEVLTDELVNDGRLNEIEKCVVLLQMFTFVGDDLYDKYIKNYPEKCSRKDSEDFLKENASYIEY